MIFSPAIGPEYQHKREGYCLQVLLTFSFFLRNLSRDPNIFPNVRYNVLIGLTENIAYIHTQVELLHDGSESLLRVTQRFKDTTTQLFNATIVFAQKKSQQTKYIHIRSFELSQVRRELFFFLKLIQ